MPDAMTICKRLVEVEAAMAGGPLASNQGQPMDGYAALANFRALAKDAALLFMPDQDKATGVPGSDRTRTWKECGGFDPPPPGRPAADYLPMGGTISGTVYRDGEPVAGPGSPLQQCSADELLRSRGAGVPGSPLRPVSMHRREGFVHAVKVNPEDYMVADDKPGSPTPEERFEAAYQAWVADVDPSKENMHWALTEKVAAAIRAAVAEERAELVRQIAFMLKEHSPTHQYAKGLETALQIIRARA